MNKGDIYTALVVKEDEPNVTKARPVVIIERNKDDIKCYVITSQNNRFTNGPGYHKIIRPNEAGLTKDPSYVKWYMPIIIKSYVIGNYVGQLSEEDLKKLRLL